MIDLSKIKISSPIILIGLFFSTYFSRASIDSLFVNSDSLNNNKIWALGTTASAGTITAFSVLSQEWYGEYEKVPFHFFNDNQDWLQMDKVGHGLSAYFGGYYGYNALKWTGLKENKSVWIGGMYGFTFLLVTEAMDGYSSGWGASTGDLLANGVGTFSFIGQQLFFGKQVIVPKFSFWPSEFSKYRPTLLGDSPWNTWLKDYNGQTYWLTSSFRDLGIKSKKWPKWLSVSAGYSGDGMLGGSYNPEFDANGNPLPNFDRKREFFLSLDLNFQNIKTKSHFLNAFLKGISFIKVPFPAIGLVGGELKYYALKL